MYSTGLERFISVDPLVKEYPSWTPYMYAMGRVIEGVDLEGLEFVDAKMRMVEAARVSEKREDITFEEYMRGTRSPMPEIPDMRYRPRRDVRGRVIIDNNFEAIMHYYLGKGEKVVLGPKTVELIKNSKDVQYRINRIVSGETPGPAEGERGINLEGLHRGFHLGRMTMDYWTLCIGVMIAKRW